MRITTAAWVLIARVRAWFRPSSTDSEFQREMESHILLRAEDHMRAGMSATEARRRALIEFGGRASLADQHRAIRGLPTLDVFVQDLRYAIRLLRRRPWISTLSILTIALGLGSTTTLFSVAYGVLFKPLPFPAGHELVRLREWREGGDIGSRAFLTTGTFDAWRASATTLQNLAGWNAHTATLVVPGHAPERAEVVESTASLFDVLDVRPMIGAPFVAGQQIAGNDRVALLAYRAWQRDFTGDTNIIGERVTVDGESLTIIGVMPQDFRFPSRETVLWKPLVPRRLLDAVARMKPGFSPHQVAEEGTARSRSAPDLGSLGMAIFGSTGPSRVDAVPLRAALAGGIQPIILLVFGAAALMLSIATMNVAGVQLARTAARRRELAIRSAIGASRGRIARQVVLENIVVGCLGGAFGLAIAVVLHAALLPRVATIGGARIDEPAFDWPVLLFGFALTLIVSALCAVVPAVMANRVSVTRALTEDGQAPVGGALRIKTTRVRAAMMTGQVAIAAVLLSGALLVTRSFINAVAVDRGYQPHGLLTARLPLPTAEFPRVKRASTLDEIIARLEQSPGVTHAAATDILPLIDLEFPRSFEMPSRQAGAGVVTVKAMSRSVTRDYFATMGMRVVEGRGFGEGDTLTSLPVALVNRTFARRYLDERQSLGALIPIKFSAGKVNWQVVGVVDDVRNLRAGDPPQPEIFGCSCQMTGGMLTDFPAVVVRTSGDPTAFAPSLRTVVQQIAPTVSLDSVMTMDDRLSASVAGPRLSMTLLVSFAGFALLVAGVGLFAMLSQSVALRARELSIRTALGARTSDVLQLVLRQALGITVLGIAAGLPVSILVGRYFRGFLFGVTPDDPVTLVVVPGTLLVVGIAATLAPALRAVRLDPAAVLKT